MNNIFIFFAYYKFAIAWRKRPHDGHAIAISWTQFQFQEKFYEFRCLCVGSFSVDKFGVHFSHHSRRFTISLRWEFYLELTRFRAHRGISMRYHKLLLLLSIVRRVKTK